MFTNLYRSIRDSVSTPVQDGEKVRRPSLPSPMQQDDQITEEGFVSIGRSSFIHTTTPEGGAAATGYPLYPHGQVQQSGQSPFYTPHPTPYQFQSQPQHQSSVEMSEVIRNVPFVLRPDLLAHLKDFIPKPAMTTNYLQQMQRPVDFSEFNYDFDFERRVILEIERQEISRGWNNGF